MSEHRDPIIPSGAKSDSRGFEDTKSDRVLVWHVDHVCEQGPGVIWGIMLADGYSMQCGIGSEGELRAKALQEKLNTILATSPIVAVPSAPREPTNAMWDSLARDLMMWLDMHPKTPRALFQHLERIGREIPQWLRDEPEMQALDHVPSKGTRCVLIYRAMYDAALSPDPAGDGER